MHWQIGATMSDFAGGVTDPNLTAFELAESMEREREIWAMNTASLWGAGVEH